jgi:putative SOS response-associated peptidase YedK
VQDRRLSNYPRRLNGPSSQEQLVIRENRKTGGRSLNLLWRGLIPHWCKDPTGGRKPINAKSETAARLPTFQEACQKRRSILPVDGFDEWRAAKQGKQPYAIAMKDFSPFGIAALGENWRDPATREWVRTFVVLTTPSNDVVNRIHDRMPTILNPAGYQRGSDSSLTARSSGPVPERAHDHRADIAARQFAGQRRRSASGQDLAANRQRV